MKDSAVVEGSADWASLYEVMKPGAYAVALVSPSTYFRVVLGVEDAGFEVRDCLHIVLGSGFNGQTSGHMLAVLARKPFTGTVVRNVLTNGVGGLNIDACRIGTADTRSPASKTALGLMNDDAWSPQVVMAGSASGRFPANTLLVHDWRCGDECFEGCPAPMLDAQSGVSKSTGGRIGKKESTAIAIVPAGRFEKGDPGFGDTGGASRFFINLKWSPNDVGLLPASLLDYVQRLISPVGGSVFRNV